MGGKDDKLLNAISNVDYYACEVHEDIKHRTRIQIADVILLLVEVSYSTALRTRQGLLRTPLLAGAGWKLSRDPYQHRNAPSPSPPTQGHLDDPSARTIDSRRPAHTPAPLVFLNPVHLLQPSTLSHIANSPHTDVSSRRRNNGWLYLEDDEQDLRIKGNAPADAWSRRRRQDQYVTPYSAQRATRATAQTGR